MIKIHKTLSHGVIEFDSLSFFHIPLVMIKWSMKEGNKVKSHIKQTKKGFVVFVTYSQV